MFLLKKKTEEKDGQGQPILWNRLQGRALLTHWDSVLFVGSAAADLLEKEADKLTLGEDLLPTTLYYEGSKEVSLQLPK